MKKLSVTRRLHFCAGHRIMGHEGACASAHGHNYVVFVTASADTVDDIGRVIDFSVLKEKIGGWIDTNWDHTFLVWEKDSETIAGLRAMPRVKEPFICTFNPTAEAIANYLLLEVCPTELQDSGVTVTKIVVHETENCFAEAVL